MTTDEIRETFLEFYASRDHKRLPSASLVPATFDPSVLLTTAGMHPLKPYFLGREQPPHQRLTSCQKCFRTTDIENVGNTARHLTFFEMLGNFSIGDYFKEGAARFAWELSIEGFGFNPEDIWITVFEGDDELGLGPDQEAIDAWLAIGVPRERIVACNREENFWQAGPTGPCGPCSELYLDRGLEYGREDDLPGGENERFLEYWNLVFMQFNQDPVNTLTPLPAQNIDTGLGLNRMALIQQGAETIFETDQFLPLIELGRELAQKETDERALRILADHSRAATFLIADGVVPSNEDRGYILRRIMRRAIQQGHRIGIEGENGLFLPLFVDRVIEVMGTGYPEIAAERDNIQRWVKAEEEGFGRTLEQGTKLLHEVIERSREAGAIPATDAFKLHDTFGFPFEVTRELALEEGLEVDTTGFDELMDQQRARARGGRAQATDGQGLREHALELVRASDFETEFVGYETTDQHTAVGEIAEIGGQLLVRLVESPFYATGGGQVSDTGEIACDGGDCRATVTDVLRLGNDQALVVELVEGELKDGERVAARVDRAARHATQCNHTATHLLHAALRERLGTHVRQAGSYVGPDKLRFDFTHGERLSPDELRDVEDRVNAWILRNDPVRPQTTTLEEAQRLGAMALFGEKYGDIVRMVEVGDGEYSRELCGGTHVRATAEIGVFKVTSEGSSAANVRRIEAITGPEAVALLREEDRLLRESAATLKTQPERLPEAVVALQQKARQAVKAGAAAGGADETALAGQAADVAGASVVAATVEGIEPKQLMDVADRVKGRLGDHGVVVLGAVTDGKVSLVVAVAPALVQRGVKAGAVVKEAAQVVGGGGGGRDTIAQAGGKDAAKLPDALATAKAAIERALS
jgi:alanyl-tRNA synthetase